MNKVKQLSNGGLGRSSALVYSDVFCRWVKKPAQPSVLQQVFLQLQEQRDGKPKIHPIPGHI